MAVFTAGALAGIATWKILVSAGVIGGGLALHQNADAIADTLDKKLANVDFMSAEESKNLKEQQIEQAGYDVFDLSPGTSGANGTHTGSQPNVQPNYNEELKKNKEGKRKEQEETLPPVARDNTTPKEDFKEPRKPKHECEGDSSTGKIISENVKNMAEFHAESYVAAIGIRGVAELADMTIDGYREKRNTKETEAAKQKFADYLVKITKETDPESPMSQEQAMEIAEKFSQGINEQFNKNPDLFKKDEFSKRAYEVYNLNVMKDVALNVLRGIVECNPNAFINPIANQFYGAFNKTLEIGDPAGEVFITKETDLYQVN